MKLLVFVVCTLTYLTLANGKPCRGDSCRGYHHYNKRQISHGGAYNSQVDSHAEYASINANAVEGATGSVDGSESVDDISGHSGEKEGGVGGMRGRGWYGGGGRYNGYSGYRSNYYCPSCHVESIGVARPNFNTVHIKRLQKE